MKAEYKITSGRGHAGLYNELYASQSHSHKILSQESKIDNREPNKNIKTCLVFWHSKENMLTPLVMQYSGKFRD